MHGCQDDLAGKTLKLKAKKKQNADTCARMDPNIPKGTQKKKKGQEEANLAVHVH